MKSIQTFLVRLALVLALLPGAVAQANTTTYFHNDLLGSPVAATDSSGSVIWRESYRPYGERLTNSPASQGNDVWFTSRRQDVDTGLVYMGARYYDPVVGRFVSRDPVGFSEKSLHSFNRYAYANNNPYKYVDPDGKAAAFAIEIIGIGLIAGAGYQRLSPEQQAAVVNGIRTLGSYTIFGQLGQLIYNEADKGEARTPPVPDAKPGRETKGRTRQWEKPGDMQEANDDFDSHSPQDVRDLPNGGRVGVLPDGRTIVVRPDSTDGRPTLEIQDGKSRDKVRYGE